jgi:hypothetical protein
VLIDGERCLAESRTYGRKSLLGQVIAICQAEIPVVYACATPVPLVGPGKDEGACATLAERCSNLPLQRLGLLLLAISAAIQPYFGHQQRTLARDVLEPRKVSFQALLRFKVYVETGKIEKGKIQVLCRRVVYIRNKTIWVFGFGCTV